MLTKNTLSNLYNFKNRNHQQMSAKVLCKKSFQIKLQIIWPKRIMRRFITLYWNFNKNEKIDSTNCLILKSKTQSNSMVRLKQNLKAWPNKKLSICWNRNRSWLTTLIAIATNWSLVSQIATFLNQWFKTHLNDNKSPECWSRNSALQMFSGKNFTRCSSHAP